MKPEDVIKLAALHRHWIIADAVRVVLRQKVVNPDGKGKDKYSPKDIELGELLSMMCRMQVWYALLFVVVEGYQELGYKYEPLDKVLEQEEYVKLLKRYRNATFHYQKEPINEKLVAFLDKEDSENWIRDLNKQLEAFFQHILPMEEAMAKIERNGFPELPPDSELAKIFLGGKHGEAKSVK